MAPYSMRCLSCGEYIYRGRKFNARKETVQGEDYYGIKIFRFYVKCTRCSAEITFKTDPKNTDYQAEHGASRNFHPSHEEPADGGEDDDPLARFAEEERLRELEAAGQSSSAKRIMEQEGQDPMATLEARQAESKREMEVMDALQDIRSRNARMDRVDAGAVIEALAAKRAGKSAQNLEDEERRRAEEEDEELVRKYFSRAEDLGGAEEAKELKDSLAGGGAPAASTTSPSESDSTTGIKTPVDGHDIGTASAKEPRSGGVVVKRALLDATADEDDKEPEAKSLLSERARELLHGTHSSTAAIPPPAKKKKKGGAFGIVRKKA